MVLPKDPRLKTAASPSDLVTVPQTPSGEAIR